MFYILKKSKNKFILKETNEKVKYSYSQIPINEKQYKKIITSGKMEKSNGCYVLSKDLDEENYKIYLKRFTQLVNEHKKNDNNYESVPNKKIITPVYGTSKLCRKDGLIWVAYRKQKKDGSFENITRINVVCIDDCKREEFFKDCNYLHPGYYKISMNDGYEYDKWNRIMSEEYFRQKSMVENASK